MLFRGRLVKIFLQSHRGRSWSENSENEQEISNHQRAKRDRVPKCTFGRNVPFSMMRSQYRPQAVRADPGVKI